MLTDEQLRAIEKLMDPLCKLNCSARADGDHDVADAAGDSWWGLESLLQLTSRQRMKMRAECN